MVVICCVYLEIQLGDFLIKTLMKVKTNIAYCLEIFLYVICFFFYKLYALIECI